jgi:hypothetical protein
VARFDPSLLTYFRRRLARSGDSGRLFAKVREVAAATGVLAGRTRPGGLPGQVNHGTIPGTSERGEARA